MSSASPAAIGPTFTAVSSSRRWLALDVLRAIAVLAMIQGHTFTALLRADEYDPSWSRWYRLFHGLTAPMFLLGGGLAYGIVTLRVDVQKGRDTTRLLRRGVMLIVLGYALQVPRASWSVIVADERLLGLLLRVGPLQLVGACLLIAEALRGMLRSRAAIGNGIAVTAATIAIGAPWVWNARGSSHAPGMVGPWLDGHAGSLFPFFPWAAFFFLGVFVSRWLGRVRDHRNGERWAAVALIGGGVGAAGFAYVLYSQGLVLRGIYGEHELWHTNPLYVLFRAGLVFVLLGLLSASEPVIRWLWRSLPTVEQIVGVIARQSLVAYVVHLLVLYGSPLNTSLAKLGPTLELWEASAIASGLLLFTVAVSAIWDQAITQGLLRKQMTLLWRGLTRVRVGEVDRIGEGERHDAIASKQQIKPAATPGHSV